MTFTYADIVLTIAALCLIALVLKALNVLEPACRRYDTALFFPSHGDNRSAYDAKQICHRCPIEDACFAAAIERREQFGIWGGASFGNHRNKRIRSARG